MRSRKKYALIAAACVVVIGAALLIYGALGRKPFRGLEPRRDSHGQRYARPARRHARGGGHGHALAAAR